jgi:hypothetical protein
MKQYFFIHVFYALRSRGSAGKGKDSEYENLESENGGDDSEGEDADADAGARPLLPSSVSGQPPAPLRSGRDSEQREIDEFEEEERRLLAEEAKVGGAFSFCRFFIT